MIQLRLAAPALLAGALFSTSSFAATQVSPLTIASLATTSYTQDFDTLAASGLSNTLPTGWQIAETGTSSAVDGQYAAGTGSSNAGNAYSFGTNGDRALGSLTSGTNSPISFGFVFTNDTGATINSLLIGYTGEQWRAANAPSDTLSFQYAIGGTDVTDAGGTWTAVTGLDFTNLQSGPSAGTALDGNLAANSKAISATIANLSIAQGASIAIRWVDVDQTGSDDGLAIDNFALSANPAVASGVPEPASWAMMVGGFGLIGSAMRRRKPALAGA